MGRRLRGDGGEEPGVLLDLRDGDAALGLLLHHGLQQVAELLGAACLWELEGGGADGLVEVHQVLAHERHLAEHEAVERHAERPHVGGPAARHGAGRAELWGVEGGGAHRPLQGVVVVDELLGDAEIAELGDAVFCQEQVLGL